VEGKKPVFEADTLVPVAKFCLFTTSNMSSPQPPRAAAAPSPAPTQASEAASLTVDSAVLTGPLRDLTTATTTLATSLGNQATQISHQLELVDRALLEGLEKLAVKSEDTNITLSRLLASTEHLLERGNAHVLQAGLNINTGIATFTEASERDADFQAAQTLAERMGQGAREQMAADVTLISGDLAMMNRNVREVRDLQTRLFADAAGGYDWLSPQVRAVYHWVCDMVSTYFLR
jgi:hypothetical protein